MARIELKVNGRSHTVQAEPGDVLLYVLRDELSLTGTKYGCGEGQCGACTVLLDGKAARSCSTTVERASGAAITTIEGLAEGDRLHPLQEAFLEEDALQCGYCTPGMVMSALALLNADPDPSREEIIRHMDGNVCRCGAYPRILAAIERAAERVPEGSK